jgi:hypothetical protein
MGTGSGVSGLTQSPSRQHVAGTDLTASGHEDVEIARQLHMLKPVVEDMHGDPERAFGDDARQMAIFADTDDRLRQLTGEHQRLITGAIDIGEHRVTVGHDHDTINDPATLITPAEYRRAFTTRDQPLDEAGDERRLAGAADAEIADADHRSLQPSSCFRMPLEPLAAGASHRAVQRIQDHAQRTPQERRAELSTWWTNLPQRPWFMRGSPSQDHP